MSDMRMNATGYVSQEYADHIEQLILEERMDYAEAVFTIQIWTDLPVNTCRAWAYAMMHGDPQANHPDIVGGKFPIIGQNTEGSKETEKSVLETMHENFQKYFLGKKT